MLAIEQRANAHTVTSKQNRLFPGVIKGYGKLAIEILDKIRAFLFVEMNDHLGVGFGAKMMPLANKLLAQFKVIEDLTVKDDPHRSILIANRLPSPLQVNDAQARMSKANQVVLKKTEPIGSPMA